MPAFRHFSLIFHSLNVSWSLYWWCICVPFWHHRIMTISYLIQATKSHLNLCVEVHFFQKTHQNCKFMTNFSYLNLSLFCFLIQSFFRHNHFDLTEFHFLSNTRILFNFCLTELLFSGVNVEIINFYRKLRSHSLYLPNNDLKSYLSSTKKEEEETEKLTFPATVLSCKNKPIEIS